MPQPKFWSTPPDRPSAAAILLSPVAALFSTIGALRRVGVQPMRPAAPVICVGNLVVGGAGKTPTVRAVCDRLALRGLRPHILSRGYGGTVVGPHRVDPKADTAAMVGDEPLLLATETPVWVGGDRRATAAAAIEAGADVLVMDDGFQNPSLAKDLSFVVIDAGFGHGNGRVMPAGPLREPLQTGFARADCAVVIGRDAAQKAPDLVPEDVPVLTGRLAPHEVDPAVLSGPIIAFAGIGRPQKFFDTLRELGANVIETIALPDHHRYAPALLKRLELRARQAGARLATTEKDAVRLPDWFRDRVSIAPVRLGFSDDALFEAFIDQLLARFDIRQRLSA